MTNSQVVAIIAVILRDGDAANPDGCLLDNSDYIAEAREILYASEHQQNYE